MKASLFKLLFNMILTLLTKDNFNSFMDMILDAIENWAEGDPSTPDDDKTVVLALCAKIRNILDVPDND